MTKLSDSTQTFLPPHKPFSTQPIFLAAIYSSALSVLLCDTASNILVFFAFDARWLTSKARSTIKTKKDPFSELGDSN